MLAGVQVEGFQGAVGHTVSTDTGHFMCVDGGFLIMHSQHAVGLAAWMIRSGGGSLERSIVTSFRLTVNPEVLLENNPVF